MAFAQEGEGSGDGGDSEEESNAEDSEANGDSGNTVADFSEGEIEDLGEETVPTVTTTTPPPPPTPEGDYLFNPGLPKCVRGPDGDCSDGFATNEDGQCFPRGGCPEGYHGVEDDESGRCISNTEGCPEGMILTTSKKSCEYRENVCQINPELVEYRELPTPKCDPSYPTICIKSPSPKLNCEEVPFKNFKVTGSDPHGFDGDNDGIGCEGTTPPPPITGNDTTVIQDRTKIITTTTSCAPIERTVSLGPSTMASNGMSGIATLFPCHLLDGTVLLNLPTNGVDLVAAHLAGGETVNAVIANKQMIDDLGNGQAIYSADLNETMSGVTPNGGIPTTLNDNINAILLWNNAGGNDVDFIADNTLALNLIIHR